MNKNQNISNLIRDEKAQGLVEYSLILSLIALAVLSVLILFGETLLNYYQAIKSEIEKI